jgi:hypothetical protein
VVVAIHDARRDLAGDDEAEEARHGGFKGSGKGSRVDAEILH